MFWRSLFGINIDDMSNKIAELRRGDSINLQLGENSNASNNSSNHRNLVNSMSNNKFGLVENSDLVNIGGDNNTTETNEKEKKVCNEFVYLLDKSKTLFNGLK